ncbi:unnamed protein product [Prorocentrum cordatum]|uniref:Uncharacterized protein n=1 Tax=Prorocentrum cordatum TaxID=2364126 RepID=A0ABN9QQ50_9DINO|nr:unnamed protein product [Polarella glacialis]
MPRRHCEDPAPPEIKRPRLPHLPEDPQAAAPGAQVGTSLLTHFPVYRACVPDWDSCHAAPESLRKPATYLKGIAAECLKRCSRGELVALSMFCRGRTYTFGSVCAGSDAPVLAVRAAAEAIREVCTSTFQMVHQFSCDCDPKKQKFLKAAFSYDRSRGPKLFGDVKSLKDDDAYEFSRAPRARASVPRDPDGVIGGFPCKTVSACNENEAEDDSRTCVADGTGQTGEVFHHILDYMDTLDTTKPLASCLPLSIFENVCRLATPPKGKSVHESNLATTMRLLADRGWHAQAAKLDPRCFATPQSRARIYIPCVRVEFLDSLGVSKCDFYARFNEFLGRFTCHGAAPLEDFLLAEDDPAVQGCIDRLGRSGVGASREDMPSGLVFNMQADMHDWNDQQHDVEQCADKTGW